jgi:hypothetical protein
MKTLWKVIITLVFLAIVAVTASFVFDWARSTETVNEEGKNITPATSTKIIVYSPKSGDAVNSRSI